MRSVIQPATPSSTPGRQELGLQQGREQISSEWILFIDADVRLQSDALQRALAQAIEENADC